MKEHIEKSYNEYEVDSLKRMLDDTKWLKCKVSPLLSPNTGDSRGVILVQAAPGNGTEYRFLLVRTDGEMQNAMGVADGWLLAMEPGHTVRGTMSVRHLMHMHPSYVMEKLGMNLSDAVALSLILYRVGREYEI